MNELDIEIQWFADIGDTKRPRRRIPMWSGITQNSITQYSDIDMSPVLRKLWLFYSKLEPKLARTLLACNSRAGYSEVSWKFIC